MLVYTNKSEVYAHLDYLFYAHGLHPLPTEEECTTLDHSQFSPEEKLRYEQILKIVEVEQVLDDRRLWKEEKRLLAEEQLIREFGGVK